MEPGKEGAQWRVPIGPPECHCDVQVVMRGSSLCPSKEGSQECA